MNQGFDKPPWFDISLSIDLHSSRSANGPLNMQTLDIIMISQKIFSTFWLPLDWFLLFFFANDVATVVEVRKSLQNCCLAFGPIAIYLESTTQAMRCSKAALIKSEKLFPGSVTQQPKTIFDREKRSESGP